MQYIQALYIVEIKSAIVYYTSLNPSDSPTPEPTSSLATTGELKYKFITGIPGFARGKFFLKQLYVLMFSD
jgi:hypothetical protein